MTEVLGDDPWDKQRQILTSVQKNAYTAVRSCHGAGKTWIAARACLWFLQCFPGSCVITTAPSTRQVKELLWRQIRGAFENSKIDLLGRLLTTQIDIAPEWYATGFATDEPINFQGPHCLSCEHTILTKRGWLGIDEISEADQVLSVPLNGQTAQWAPVDAVHRYSFSGELNVFENRTLSFAVTDEHRFPTKGDGRSSYWKMSPFADVKTRATVRALSEWEGEPFGVPEPFRAYGWSPEQFAEFLGFWIGDGGLRMHTKTGRFYEVLLYQIKPDGGYCRALLPGVKVNTGRDHVVFCNRACAEWLAENVGRYQVERRIPRFLLDAPSAVLQSFCEGFWRAEGSFERGQKRQVYNTNGPLMGQVQEILIKLGRPSTLGINRRDRESGSVKGRRTGPWRPCWVLSWVKEPSERSFERGQVRREPYEGRVWCISTPLQTFYTRRHGKVFLSGNSPKGVLFCGDEASGLAEWVFDTARGFMTQDNAKMLLIGNPNYAHGSFYDAFQTKRYKKIHISAFDVPKHILRPDWKKEMLEDFGSDSPIYQIRVMGNFPTQATNALFDIAWVEAAFGRQFPETVDAVVEIGVDVARYGDCESVAYVRAGQQVIDHKVWRGKDTMKSASIVAELCRQYWPKKVKVDEIGIGSAVVDRLRELHWPVEGVNSNGAPRYAGEFFNLRAEQFASLASLFAKGAIGIPRDKKLMRQLLGLTYEHTPKGTRKVVGKEELRRAGRESPDRADALMLCFAGSHAFYRAQSLAASREGGVLPKVAVTHADRTGLPVVIARSFATRKVS